MKKIKDLEFDLVTDVKPDGYEGNAPGRKRIVKRKAVFVYQLKNLIKEKIKELGGPTIENENPEECAFACEVLMDIFEINKKEIEVDNEDDSLEETGN